MSVFKEFPTKTQLAQLLDETQIKDAIIEHQKQNATWAAAQPRSKQALIGIASLKTLLKATLKLYEEKKDVENTQDLRRYLAELEGTTKPTETAAISTSTAAATSSTASTSSTTFTDLSKEQLKNHLTILVSAGLMTQEVADKYDSFWALCPSDRQSGDSKQVYDAMNLEVFDETKGDIVRLSDNRCYSKSAMLEFMQSGTVNITTGQIVLPLSLSPIKDVDYTILGLQKPSAATRRQAREAQGIRSAEQLWRGDIEAWRSGSGRAEEAFAYFVTDPQERKKLARQLGVRVRDLAQPYVNATHTVTTNAVIPLAANAENTNASTVAAQSIQTLKKSVLVCDELFSLAITENGKVYKIRHGTELPDLQDISDKQFIAVAINLDNSFALDTDGQIHAWSPYGEIDEGYDIEQLQELNQNKNFTLITGTESGLFALNEDGKVYSYEDESHLARKLNRKVDAGQKIVNISGGKTHLLAILNDGSVIGVGNDANGKATQGQSKANGKKFIAISAGSRHSLGLLDDGTVVGWGSNSAGQSTNFQNQTASLLNEKFVDIAAGNNFSVGLLSNGQILNWPTVALPMPLILNKTQTISAYGDRVLAILDDDKTIVDWDVKNNSHKIITHPNGLKFKRQTLS